MLWYLKQDDDCTWKQITTGYFKTSWVKQWLNKHSPGHRVKGNEKNPFCKCFSLFQGPWSQFPSVSLGDLWQRVLLIKQGLCSWKDVQPNANWAGISSSGGGHVESMSYIRLLPGKNINYLCWTLPTWASCEGAGGVWRTTCGDLIYRERGWNRSFFWKWQQLSAFDEPFQNMGDAAAWFPLSYPAV